MEAGRRTRKKDRRLPVNIAWVKGWHSLLESRTGQVELPETAEQERKRVLQHRVPKTPPGKELSGRAHQEGGEGGHVGWWTELTEFNLKEHPGTVVCSPTSGGLCIS